MGGVGSEAVMEIFLRLLNSSIPPREGRGMLHDNAKGYRYEPTRRHERPAVRVRRAAWLARAAFLLVFAINVQCAASFVLWPDVYAPSFEVAACWTPRPCRASASRSSCGTPPTLPSSPARCASAPWPVIVLVQRAIGLAGESWLRFGLPAGHAALSASIERFIYCSTPQASC